MYCFASSKYRCVVSVMITIVIAVPMLAVIIVAVVLLVGKDKVCSQVALQAEAYPGFSNMKRLGVFPLPP